MPRDISTANQNALEADVVWPVIFVELEFDSGFTRVWNGTCEITWDSKSWLPGAGLASISVIRETKELQANGVELVLNGVGQDWISTVLSEPYRNRPVRIWRGFCDADGGIVVDPIRIFTGVMDTTRLIDSIPGASISVKCENWLKDFNRPRESRWNHEYQKSIAENDRSCEYIAAMAEKQIVWGRANPAGAATGSYVRRKEVTLYR